MEMVHNLDHLLKDQIEYHVHRTACFYYCFKKSTTFLVYRTFTPGS